jgi:hypothetical protein
MNVLIDIHVEVLHDPAGLGFQFNLGNGLHFAGGDHALINLTASDFVQAAGIEVRAPGTAHDYYGHNRKDDEREETAPDPDSFTFTLRRHKTPA